MPNEAVCENYCDAQPLGDKASYDTETKKDPDCKPAIAAEENVDNIKEISVVGSINEHDCAGVLDAETAGHNDQDTKNPEPNSSKNSQVDETLKDGSGGNSCDKDHVHIVEETARNTSDDGEKNEMIDNMATNMNVTRDDLVELIPRDSKNQRNDSCNEKVVETPQDETRVLEIVEINEDKTRQGPFSNSHLSQYITSKPGSLAIKWHEKNDDKCSVIEGDISFLAENEEGTSKVGPKQQENSKDGATKTKDLQSFLDYDVDGMMTDSQINLLDEDMLALPQRYVKLILSMLYSMIFKEEGIANEEKLRMN